MSQPDLYILSPMVVTADTATITLQTNTREFRFGSTPTILPTEAVDAGDVYITCLGCLRWGGRQSSVPHTRACVTTPSDTEHTPINPRELYCRPSLDGKTVLDGEIVCLDKPGKPQFGDLLFIGVSRASSRSTC